MEGRGLPSEGQENAGSTARPSLYSKVTERLLEARKSLLDLSLRNRLLNFRPSKRTTIQIIDELSEEIFNLLVIEKKSMAFLPGVEIETKAEEEYLSIPQPKEDDIAGSGKAKRHIDRNLQTRIPSANLQHRLRTIFYESKTFIEEQGVNILYLALGFLCWFESEDSEDVKKAPLILVPIKIERSDVNSRFRVTYTDDEILTNLSLSEKLRTDFGLILPELPDVEEINPKNYFQLVSDVVSSQTRWKVCQDEISLGFFSFGKFLMYVDLDPKNWPEDSKLNENPIIFSLLEEEGFREPPGEYTEDAHLDEHVDPIEVFNIKDADSSQNLAILDVRSGRNLVIQGPPGTGKSQTITNIIADSLSQNKKVLFVSEKMAALEVVKRRLEEIGLGAACLELHSHKTNKKAFLYEIKKTLELGKPIIKNKDRDLEFLKLYRDKTNAYCEALNTPIENSELTPYFVQGKLCLLRDYLEKLIGLRFEDAIEWTPLDYARRRSRLEELSEKLDVIGIPNDHPWVGVELKVLLPTEHGEIKAFTVNAKNEIMNLKEEAKILSDNLNCKIPDTIQDVELNLNLIEQIITAPRFDKSTVKANAWFENPNRIEELIKEGELYFKIEKNLTEVLKNEAWGKDYSTTRDIISKKGNSILRFFSITYLKCLRNFKKALRIKLPKELKSRLDILDNVLAWQQKKRNIENSNEFGKSIFGANWLGIESDWDLLKKIWEWMSGLCQKLNLKILPAYSIDVIAEPLEINSIKKSQHLVGKHLNHFKSVFNNLVEKIGLKLDEAFQGKSNLTVIKINELEQKLLTWEEKISTIHDWISYYLSREECKKDSLKDLVERVNNKEIDKTNLISIYDTCYFKELFDHAFANRKELSVFNGISHNKNIEKFRELDQGSLEVSREKLALNHWNTIPQIQGGSGTTGILQREIEKKRRHLPIRKLISSAGHLIQEIKPVFMMGPLSVAQFLPQDSIKFDLVIFDEASQVEPVDALGSIARGKQVIVVGDDKQLPPTNFFHSLVEDQDIDDEQFSAGKDVESILSLFSAQGASQRMLKWHYRSQHESLIAISNKEFYDSKLFIFPSPDAQRKHLGLKLNFIKEGIYDRGKSKKNNIEARAVAEAVINHVQNYPDFSLGVAAFSQAQQEAISDQLELLQRERDLDVEKILKEKHEYENFFVKNLENVQGDERDVIFISVGYGKDENGYMAMTFGPLNRDGGERRLNVLITRARKRCEVFSSIKAEDIDLKRTQSRGVTALRSYLYYAETGILEIGIGTGKEPDSPFEEAVLKEIKSLGYEAEPQIGVAGFFIDLAILHPKNPGSFILGIECDGKSYHSARSARDRDRLRQDALEALGWRIHRIWSTDWFKNPDKEIKKLAEAVKKAIYDNEIENRAFVKKKENDPQIFTLERRKVVDGDRSKDSSCPYCIYNESFPQQCEPHKLPSNELAKLVIQIVETEGPIHFEELTRRVTHSFGLQRTGNRIVAAVNDAVNWAEIRGNVCIKGAFVWPFSMDRAPVRNRAGLDALSKKLGYISPEEWDESIKICLKEKFGLKKTELSKSVARKLGYKSSADFEVLVNEHVDHLFGINAINEKGGKIFLKE